jgi:hypothetical protein
MVDPRIGQKDEIALVLSRGLHLTHTQEREVAPMPDCVAVCARTKVASVIKRRSVMRRWMAALFAVVGILGAGQAYAQDAVPGPGAVVVTIIPGGATFFTEGKDASGPSFGNYDLGAGVEVHINRYIGVEGEVSGALGIAQDLQFGGQTSNLKSPNLLNYSGNLVVSAANHSSVVPYVTGGIGGLSLFDTSSLGIADTTTFLTGNVGAGVKWFNGRWGLRGDYRFITVRSNDQAPAFFGQETRYGHRVYGGVLINAGR